MTRAVVGFFSSLHWTTPSVCDCGRLPWSSAELSLQDVSAAVECVHRLALAADTVWLESVVMQVEFETLYALSTHCRDIDRQRSEAAQQRRVDDLLAIDVRAASSASQQSVVAFYSTLFQLCLHSSALTSEDRAPTAKCSARWLRRWSPCSLSPTSTSTSSERRLLGALSC